MLIVTTEEFIKMPAGTIFAPFEPNEFAFLEDLEIKVDGGDGETYLGTMPIVPWLDPRRTFAGPGQYEVDYEIYDGSSAEISMYELVAVLEPKDVLNLISKLVWALNGCKNFGEEKTE